MKFNKIIIRIKKNECKNTFKIPNIWNVNKSCNVYLSKSFNNSLFQIKKT